MVNAKLNFIHRTALLVVFCVVLLVLSGLCIVRLDRIKKHRATESDFAFVPNPAYARITSLGFENTLSSWYWLRSVAYFADAYVEKRPYTWLPPLLNVVIELNPKYKPAYYFGGLLLCDQKEYSKEGIAILRTGIREFPDEARFRIFAGMCQLGYDSNYVAAADFLMPLSKMPSAPQYARTLAWRLLQRSGQTEIALDLALLQYFEAGSEMEKSLAIERLGLLVPSISRAELSHLLNAASINPHTYRQVRGLFTQHLQRLN